MGRPYNSKNVIPADSVRQSREMARRAYEEHFFEKGHKLPEEVVVHHIDGNPWNNDITNLKIMSHDEHTKHHRYGKGKYGIPHVGNEKEYNKVCNTVNNKLYYKKVKNDPILLEKHRRENREYARKKREEAKLINQYQ